MKTWYERLSDRCEYKVLHDRDRIEDPYMVRYTVLKTKVGTIYLHKIIRSDSTQDYHDHPWPFFHVILKGGYEEQRPGISSKMTRRGSFAFRRASYAHRLQLNTDAEGREIETWTLVVIGPKIREWGFIGRLTGCWVGWKEYIFGKDRCE